MSFYFATNVDGRVHYGPVLENIVYRYARSKQYQVSVGRIGKLEVDFILQSPTLDYEYVQVARTIYGEEDEQGRDKTEEREYRPLEQIQDNYPKYVLSLDFLLQKRNGILHKNLIQMMENNEGF